VEGLQLRSQSTRNLLEGWTIQSAENSQQFIQFPLQSIMQ
jgi:hypothetical protein